MSFFIIMGRGLLQTLALRPHSGPIRVSNDEYWKPIYFCQKVEITSHKTGTDAGLYTFVSAGLFQLFVVRERIVGFVA